MQRGAVERHDLCVASRRSHEGLSDRRMAARENHRRAENVLIRVKFLRGGKHPPWRRIWRSQSRRNGLTSLAARSGAPGKIPAESQSRVAQGLSGSGYCTCFGIFFSSWVFLHLRQLPDRTLGNRPFIDWEIRLLGSPPNERWQCSGLCVAAGERPASILSAPSSRRPARSREPAAECGRTGRGVYFSCPVTQFSPLGTLTD